MTQPWLPKYSCETICYRRGGGKRQPISQHLQQCIELTTNQQKPETRKSETDATVIILFYYIICSFVLRTSAMPRLYKHDLHTTHELQNQRWADISSHCSSVSTMGCQTLFDLWPSRSHTHSPHCCPSCGTTNFFRSTSYSPFKLNTNTEPKTKFKRSEH